MKGFIVVVMAVLMLGLALPGPSEANDAWVPAAIIGGIIVGAAVAQAAHPAPVHAYYAPEPVRVYHAPCPVYVQPRHAPKYYNGYRHDRWDSRYEHRRGSERWH